VRFAPRMTGRLVPAQVLLNAGRAWRGRRPGFGPFTLAEGGWTPVPPLAGRLGIEGQSGAITIGQTRVSGHIAGEMMKKKAAWGPGVRMRGRAGRPRRAHASRRDRHPFRSGRPG